MAKRLIIRHGERVTRHEITDKAIVIGRDPSCDLFFSDYKLSRRHARMEPEAGKLKIVDLRSRNGSWVNEKRINERFIEPSDAIRLGGLRIAYEEDPPAKSGNHVRETTQVNAPNVPDGRSDTEPPDDTVLFLESVPPDEESTIVLSEPPPPDDEAGTLVFPEENKKGGTTTRVIPVLDKTKPLGAEPEGTKTLDPAPPSAAGKGRRDTKTGNLVIDEPTRRGSSTASLLVPAGACILVYLLLLVPLLFKTRSDLYQESLQRGQTLFNLLLRSNAHLLGTGQLAELSVEAVRQEPGVTRAFVLDLNGRIAAPRDQLGESYEIIEGIEASGREIDRFRQGVASSGDIVFVGPLIHEGRRVGVAVMSYSVAPMAREIWVPLLVVMGLLVFVAVVIVALAFDRRGSHPIRAANGETTLAESPVPAVKREPTDSVEREDD